MNVSVGEQ